MFGRTFWLPFFRIGLYTLLSYVVIAYFIFFVTLVRWEVSLLPSSISVVTPVSKDSGSYSIVSSRIHNVFGDPIPYAVVHISGRIVQADSTGHFTLEGIVPNRYSMEIFAGGYRRYKWDIHVEEGTNTPIIKYDTGLWPAFFLPDFHVFHYTNDALYGIIGFANGSDQPLYIHRITIYDPREDIVIDFLNHSVGLEYFQNLSGKVEIVKGPQKALRLAPQSWFTGDLPPVTTPLLKGIYHMEIHFGTQREHDTSTYQVMRIKDQLDVDSNWNPHLP